MKKHPVYKDLAYMDVGKGPEQERKLCNTVSLPLRLVPLTLHLILCPNKYNNA